MVAYLLTMENGAEPPYKQIQALVAGNTSIRITDAIPESMISRGPTDVVPLRTPRLLETVTMALLPPTTMVNLFAILIIRTGTPAIKNAAPMTMLMQWRRVSPGTLMS